MVRLKLGRRLAVLLAVFVSLFATPTLAAIAVLTIQGTATSAGSYAPFAGSFPQFGAGQQPAPYTLTFTYDTAAPPSPINQANLTILNGSYILDTFSLSSIGPNGGAMRFRGEVPTGGAYIQADVIGGFGGGIGAPFSLNCPQGCGSGAFQLPFSAGALNLTVTSASSIILPTPAPEPQAWALMITGFGMIGLMLRRRRRAHGLGQELGRVQAPATA